MLTVKIHKSLARVKVLTSGHPFQLWRNDGLTNLACSLTTVDGSEIRLKHKLRLAVYPIIYKVLAPSQVVV